MPAGISQQSMSNRTGPVEIKLVMVESKENLHTYILYSILWSSITTKQLKSLCKDPQCPNTQKWACAVNRKNLSKGSFK